MDLLKLKSFYKVNGRVHLPWRKTQDPYKILVSEIMLQQTQVDRVLPKYKAFIHEFPTLKKLAEANFKDVLLLWSGLGYNRRAKFLHEAVKVVLKDHQGRLPRDVAVLVRLPGIGPYTARAIAAFAYNQPVVFIETNIRTVLFYYFSFLQKTKKPSHPISDAELLPFVAEALKKSNMEPRDFYAALMDYGSYLKQSGVRLNKQSTHYTKQTTFKGSTRQLRGAILRELLVSPQTITELIVNCKRTSVEVQTELAHLLQEQLIQKKGKKFAIEG